MNLYLKSLEYCEHCTCKCLLILKFWCNNSQNILSNSCHSLLTKSSTEENCFQLFKKQNNKNKTEKKKKTTTKQSYFGMRQNQRWESLPEKQNPSVFWCSPFSLHTMILFFLFIHILLLEIWQNLYFLFEIAVTVFSNQNISHVPSGVCLLEGPKLQNVAF